MQINYELFDTFRNLNYFSFALLKKLSANKHDVGFDLSIGAMGKILLLLTLKI